MGDQNPTSPKLPIPGKRNVLITSALPYVNNVPHLGNIIGSVLSADVFARYCRLRGYNAIYICGTDEYGTTTETKAMEENCTPQEICDKYHALHKEVYDWFDISFDKFGRTSTPEQTEVCQAIFKKIWENNWLTENTMQQLFCDTCQRFLADRLVEGTCPDGGCNYDSARGDQCEKCGKLLNPTELKEPRCKACQNTPRIRDTRHLFLELPLLKDKLVEYINKMSVAGSWSQNAIYTTQAWLTEGLKARCITRDLKWGVPVPHENFKDKVFYVWFDAPIGYVSITSCYTSDWEKWWKNPENVELFQFMGKDNIPFHTVMFPSTLLGTGENWTLMKSISVTEYLNYEAGKFSKSKGIGVFGNDVKDTKIPAEVWRYYLLTNRPEVSDTLFTWDDLQAKLNNELLSNLGNFINRVLSFIAKPLGQGYGSIIPDAPTAESHPLTKALGEKVGKHLEQYIEAMEKVKLKQGLRTAMSLSSEGNAYLQESQFLKLYKEDQPSCSTVMRTAVGLVHILACLLEPFIPSFSIEVFKQLNLPPQTQISLCDEKGDVDRARRLWEIIPAGHKIGDPKPLFEELKTERVEELRQKYSGSQADKRAGAEAAAAAKTVEQPKKTKISDISESISESRSQSPNRLEIGVISISGIPPDIRERELLKILEEYNGYLSLKIDHNKDDPICFAYFSSKQQAVDAISNLNDMIFDKRSNTKLHAEICDDPAEKMITEKKIYFRDSSAPRCMFFGKIPKQGLLHLSGKHLTKTRFLECESQDVGLQMLDLLDDQHFGSFLKCHRLIQKDDKWFLALERAQPVSNYFSNKQKNWRNHLSKGPPLSDQQQRASWFCYIQKDFEYIFGETARIWCNFMDVPSYRSNYMGSAEKCLWICEGEGIKKIKILPSLNNSTEGQNEIDEFREFMIRMITLPFNDDDYLNNKAWYNIPTDDVSFLHFLRGYNLAYVGLKFLLGNHPFTWIPSRKSSFMVNLMEMVKRNEIHGPTLFNFTLAANRNPLPFWTAPNFFKDKHLLAVYNNGSYDVCHIIRFCANVYRHINDNTVDELGFDPIQIEDKLTEAIPNLYLTVFEALIRYGRSNFPKEMNHFNDRKDFLWRLL